MMPDKKRKLLEVRRKEIVIGAMLRIFAVIIVVALGYVATTIFLNGNTMEAIAIGIGVPILYVAASAAGSSSVLIRWYDSMLAQDGEVTTEEWYKEWN